MNPYIVLALVIGLFAGGFRLGMDHAQASQARSDAQVAKAVEAATQTSAQAIAALRPKYTTIQNEVQREIRTNTVFAECKLPADSLRLVNQALVPGGAPAGGGKLPQPDPAGR